MAEKWVNSIQEFLTYKLIRKRHLCSSRKMGYTINGKFVKKIAIEYRKSVHSPQQSNVSSISAYKIGKKKEKKKEVNYNSNCSRVQDTLLYHWSLIANMQKPKIMHTFDQAIPYVGIYLKKKQLLQMCLKRWL